MLEYKRITYELDEYYSKSLELYSVSFPFHEQRESLSQNMILSNPLYHFDTVFDGDKFVAIVLYWQWGNYIYIEHLAVSTAERGHGYGSAILEDIKKRDCIVILEIDPPVDSVSLKRRDFYLKSGFMENTYKHVHPPYHKGIDGHPLVVMSSPNVLDNQEYDDFNLFLKDVVMDGVF